MNKIKGILKKPITWGDYCKACVFSIIFSIVYVGYMFGWFHKLAEKFLSLFRKKNVETEVE